MKRRAVLLLLAIGAAILLAGGVALATEIQCKNDACAGTNKDDEISGGGFDDYIVARNGDDVVRAGGGSDRVFGGPGDGNLFGDNTFFGAQKNDGPDTVFGGVGNDTLFGGSGNDRLFAGAGEDEIDAEETSSPPKGGGQDTVQAGFGDDLIVSQDNQFDRIDCGPGYDLVLADTGSQDRAADLVDADCEETNLQQGVMEAAESSAAASEGLEARAEELRAKIKRLEKR